MIRLIYQSMLNRKGKCLLLMVQFTIGFMALLFGLGCMNYAFQFEKYVENLSPLDVIHIYIVEDYGLRENDMDMRDKYNNVFKQLEESNLVDRLGLFELIYVSGDAGDTEGESRLYALNKDAVDMTNLTLQEGSMEPLENYKESYKNIPVVVSASLQEKYKMGATYPLYVYMDGRERIMVEVVGVLDSSVHYWTGGASYISNNIMNHSDFILAPQFSIFESYITYLSNSLVQLSGQEIEREEKMERVKTLFNQNGLNIEYRTLQDEVNDHYESQKVVMLGTMTFAAILLILSLLGCIGAILASITARYKEFGVYYSLGFTKGNMIRLVQGEITATFGLSFILAVLICKYFLGNLLTEEALIIDLHVIGMAFIVMLVCVTLCTIMPFIKISKTEPIDMIIGGYR